MGHVSNGEISKGGSEITCFTTVCFPRIQPSSNIKGSGHAVSIAKRSGTPGAFNAQRTCTIQAIHDFRFYQAWVYAQPTCLARLSRNV